MTINKEHSRQADYWQPFNHRRVECTLCPRHCRPMHNQVGFCGVRGNEHNQLRTYNYGKSLAATQEVIETEAINHYMPGARILSMGNIGCMMECSFCQNWETSQVKHLNQRLIREYTPEEVVAICVENKIEVLSWTYNDPVVWQEFVVETSRLAQQQGIKTLYKSALYIEQAPLDELLKYIDVFSISLKSLSEQFYKKHTRGRLGPVLAALQHIAKSNRHLEVSQLVIPGLNDDEQNLTTTINWIATQLGVDVPVHFVAFHPAYKYTQVQRTDINVLRQARHWALQAGIRSVYMGNVSVDGENDTLCRHCAAPLVRRYGLHAEIVNLDSQGMCRSCGTASPIKMPRDKTLQQDRITLAQDFKHKLYIHWQPDMQSVHIVKTHGEETQDTLQFRIIGDNEAYVREIRHGLDRFILAAQSKHDKGVVMSWNSTNQYDILPLLDRAHYPVTLSSGLEEIPVRVVNG